MNYNKKYNFEVFHRNSFSDEQKKEKKKLYIFISVVILFLAFIFIRSAYLYKIEFEEKVEGILKDKKIGSRGVFTIKIYNSQYSSSSKYSYHNRYDDDNIAVYEKLKIGDSLFKPFNSHIVNIYRKRKDTYIFFDSFNIKVW